MPLAVSPELRTYKKRMLPHAVTARVAKTIIIHRKAMTTFALDQVWAKEAVVGLAEQFPRHRVIATVFDGALQPRNGPSIRADFQVFAAKAEAQQGAVVEPGVWFLAALGLKRIFPGLQLYPRAKLYHPVGRDIEEAGGTRRIT